MSETNVGRVFNLTSGGSGGAYLPLAGGTVTGPLSVQAPSADGHAATKKYVDDMVGDIAYMLDSINGEVV